MTFDKNGIWLEFFNLLDEKTKVKVLFKYRDNTPKNFPFTFFKIIENIEPDIDLSISDEDISRISKEIEKFDVPVEKQRNLAVIATVYCILADIAPAILIIIFPILSDWLKMS